MLGHPEGSEEFAQEPVGEPVAQAGLQGIRGRQECLQGQEHMTGFSFNNS